MFEVGQKVKVTDQRPPAEGTIEQVSTWEKVLGTPKGNEGVCYYIRCQEWQGTGRWIGALFVEAA